MGDEPERWIWHEGEVQGPFSVKQLGRMAVQEEINFETLFWSEKAQGWKPLAGLIFDMTPDRLDQMIEAGVKRVKVLGSGEEDCEACSALANNLFSIYSPPILPPEDCRCVPWCRSILIAVEG